MRCNGANSYAFAWDSPLFLFSIGDQLERSVVRFARFYLVGQPRGFWVGVPNRDGGLTVTPVWAVVIEVGPLGRLVECRDGELVFARNRPI